MKAIQVHEFGEPDVLKLEEVPDVSAGPGQVTIDVRVVGVNPVETYIRSGKYGPRPMPLLLGSDAAGLVDGVGEGVTDLHRGDRVYVFSPLGTYAERIVAPASRVFPMPSQVSFEEAACVGVPGATAYRALFQVGGGRPAGTVLIHGATGGVGTAAVQLARAAGMHVIGTGGSEEGLDLILRLGCHHVLNHRESGYTEKLKQITGGRGVDLVLEMLANVNLERDLDAVATFGTIVIIGNRGRIEIDPRMIMGKGANVRGMLLYQATDDELREIHAGLFAAMEDGRYLPIVWRQMPLAEAAEAHRLMISGHGPGNIVLIP
jgi:NADPH2:quinone reductase